MKKHSAILLLASAVLLGAALSSCSKTKIIPDEKLARIFHDVYLTNAYAQDKYINLDSLNIYEPVFEKYGYTSEDVQYTIGNFAKRKSARLSDVVDRSIEMLTAESNFYKRRIAIYDTVGIIARERFARVIYSDSLIRVQKISDTSRLRITLPLEGPGTYEVTYSYLIDSTDRNGSLRATHYLLDERNRRSDYNTQRLKHLERDNINVKINAENRHRKLVINLNGYPTDMKRPGMTVNDLSVRYYMPDRAARDSMGRSWFDYRTLDSLANPLWNVAPGDSIIYIVLPDERTSAKDIVALPADAPGTAAP